MPENLPIVDGFIALDHLLLKAMSEIASRFPNWDWRTDERLIILAKLRNLLSCGKLAFLFEESCLANADWWKSVESSVSDFDRHPKRPLEFDNFTRFAMFQGLFSLYEAALRSLTAALTGSPPPDKLYQVRAMLFQFLPSLPQPENESFSNLMRFAGTIRNCIHNNMVHTGDDATLKFRDAEFEFRTGKPPGFLSWFLFVHLAYDLAEMFHSLALTPEIARLPEVKSLADFTIWRSAEPP
jgi:hypothetical protein